MAVTGLSQPNRVKYHHTLTRAGEETAFERHCHDKYELLFVLQGKGRFSVEGVEYEMHPNTVYFVKPSEYHFVCPDFNYPYERAVINFDGKRVDRKLLEASFLKDDDLHDRAIRLPPDRLGESAKTAFLDFDFADRFVKRENDLSELWLSPALSKLLLLLSEIPKESGKGEARDLQMKAMDYLNRHLCEEITLEQIARELFVSKFYLCRAFRRQTGISVFDYLSAKRILLAQKLLEEGTPATEVAFSVGFGDYSTFYRAFKKATGRSPKQYERR